MPRDTDPLLGIVCETVASLPSRLFSSARGACPMRPAASGAERHATHKAVGGDRQEEATRGRGRGRSGSALALPPTMRPAELNCTKVNFPKREELLLRTCTSHPRRPNTRARQHARVAVSHSARRVCFGARGPMHACACACWRAGTVQHLKRRQKVGASQLKRNLWGAQPDCEGLLSLGNTVLALPKASKIGFESINC